MAIWDTDSNETILTYFLPKWWPEVGLTWIEFPPLDEKSLLNGLHVKKSLLFGTYPHSSSYLGDATASIWGWMMEVK